MTTLITAENPGKWSRRCDAKCHMATEPACDCICGGRYHGKGRTPGALEAAVLETSTELLRDMVGENRRPGEIVDTRRLTELQNTLNQGRLL